MVELKPITSLHPKVMTALDETLNEIKARKFTVGLYHGVRTPEKQDYLYQKGRAIASPVLCAHDGLKRKIGACIEHPFGLPVTNAQAWESLHNYGLAGDLVFKNERMEWTWDVPSDSWKQLGAVGEIFGLSWGGRWKNPDYPHFEMRPPKLSMAQIKNLLFEKGIEAVWGLV